MISETREKEEKETQKRKCRKRVKMPFEKKTGTSTVQYFVFRCQTVHSS